MLPQLFARFREADTRGPHADRQMLVEDIKAAMSSCLVSAVDTRPSAKIRRLN